VACPECKGIHEQVVENAFLASYDLLYLKDKDSINEIVKGFEETLSNVDTTKNLAKIEKKIEELLVKRNKLVDLLLEGAIAKETYESKYTELTGKLEMLTEEKKELAAICVRDKDIRKRIMEFKKAIESNETPETFSRKLFEGIVDEVIIGGVDKEGRSDPHLITFVYKAGFSDTLSGKPYRYRKPYERQKQYRSSVTEETSICSNNQGNKK
jgi:hypothetical protein